MVSSDFLNVQEKELKEYT